MMMIMMMVMRMMIVWSQDKGKSHNGKDDERLCDLKPMARLAKGNRALWGSNKATYAGK